MSLHIRRGLNTYHFAPRGASWPNPESDTTQQDLDFIGSTEAVAFLRGLSRRLVFRYCDPRVLRAYLPTCFTGELDEVFGPVERFWTESEEPSSMLEFRRQANALATDRIDL